MFIELLCSFLTIKKEVQCTILNCPDDFSILKEKVRFFDPVTGKSMYVPYNGFKNIHNINFLLSEDIRNCLIENINAFDIAVKRFTGLRYVVPNCHLITNSESYVNLLKRDAYNISQCIYINAFIELFFNYCSGSCKIPKKELLSYLNLFPHYMNILELEQCSFGSRNCRIFLNSSTSIHDMNIIIDRVKNSNFNFTNYNSMPYYNDININCESHTHPTTTINYNNCLILGTGLVMAAACVYLTYHQ